MVLVGTAVWARKKLGLQSTMKNWQWWRCPNWLWQTVPNRCGRCREGTVADGSMQSTWTDKCWCTWRAQSPTSANVRDVLEIWRQEARCRTMEAAIHQHRSRNEILSGTRRQWLRSSGWTWSWWQAVKISRAVAFCMDWNGACGGHLMLGKFPDWHCFVASFTMSGCVLKSGRLVHRAEPSP